MKNFKITISAMIATIVLTISTGVFAYTGVGDVDPNYSIKMGSSLINGEVAVSGASNFSYQFVEISEAKYNAIKKLEAEFELIEVYVKWTEDRDNESKATEWKNAQIKFANAYGNGKSEEAAATEVLNKYGIGPDILTLCRNAWIVELTDYEDSKWVSAQGNKMTLDLSTFTGTKYFIGWISTGTEFDAEVYKAVGTKKEEPKQDEPKQDEPKQDEPKQEEPKKEELKQEEPKQATIKGDKTKSQGVIPHTGVNDVLKVLIVLSTAVSGVFFVRYKKIK